MQRVLQVHTRYREPGGEDQVVEAERTLLRGAGIQVDQEIFHNADLRESQSLISDLRLASSAIWSRSAERRVRAAIIATRPQVVHVHNTFPAASPSVYAAAASQGVAVVQTLHNYRFICPAATAFRDGHPCTDCVGRMIAWPGVVHACVRGSRSQSLVAASTMAVHRLRGTFSTGIGAYIALTSFQRDLMIEGGVPAERIRIVPNFIEPDPGIGGNVRRGILFVGRLSIEKGVPVLLQAAASLSPSAVSVIGNGPLAETVGRAHEAGHVRYLSSVPRVTVLDSLRQAVALVVPSIWFEGLPLVVIEAFASGTPVIASRVGSLATLGEEGATGLCAEPNNASDLAKRSQWAADHPTEMRAMGINARQRYETRFRGKAHLASLLEAYALAGRGNSP
jgi:glycosyltransferase involved in cell wall biosynthesis